MLRLSTSLTRLAPRAVLPLLLPTLAACVDDPAPAARAGGDTPPAAGAPAPAEAPATAAAAPTAGRWSGEARGGYTGNRISFVVADDGSRISDVTFEGHWDCTDGIEMTPSGPTGSYPVADGRIAVTSVEPEGGGATATRFVMEGRMEPAQATGTLRINLNALGCDTRELQWTATPGGA